ncbi:MAG: methenyltetrahydromethanopterin cyclohydrolase [Candidatus Hydrothermarchaeota archaeon]|nr:methenyltetrahydromethanopterin cyclohydrolase [Candidatus Hydrothermarchaeota archaeon]
MNLNKNAVKIAEEMLERQEELKINSFKLRNGAKIIDCGIEANGSFAAGKLFAQACTGGLAEFEFSMKNFGDFSLPSVEVATDFPALACFASQKAGWNIKGENFSAIGSGPARILAKSPKKICYSEKAKEALIALETSKCPTEKICESIAKECGIMAKNLYILIARTASLVGSIQVSARMVETALFKLDYLGYDVNAIETAFGSAPVAPVVGNDAQMMGVTNDMIIYGSKVFLYTQENIDAAKIPSNTSPAYGKPFSEIFRECGYDFYKINPATFAPAEVYVNNAKAGRINPEIIKKSLNLVFK